jgi:hypothetical protein
MRPPDPTDLFRPLPASERLAFHDRYLQYLEQRDGTLDYATHTLSRRELDRARFARDPVRWQGTVDADGFRRSQGRRVPEPGLPPLVLWLLATAKANRGERFGVDRSFATGALGRSADPCERYVETEEHYHTQILLEVVRLFGIEAEMPPPSVFLRATIEGMVRLPRELSLPLVYCGEIVGSVGFLLLLEVGRSLTAAQPAVQRRVEELFGQILVDEIGHVAYCRARLGTAGMLAARALLPLVSRALFSDVPELALLVPPERLREEVRRFDVAALAAPCPHAPMWTGPLPQAA